MYRSTQALWQLGDRLLDENRLQGSPEPLLLASDDCRFYHTLVHVSIRKPVHRRLSLGLEIRTRAEVWKIALARHARESRAARCVVACGMPAPALRIARRHTGEWGIRYNSQSSHGKISICAGPSRIISSPYLGSSLIRPVSSTSCPFYPGFLANPNWFGWAFPLQEGASAAEEKMDGGPKPRKRIGRGRSPGNRCCILDESR